MVQIPKSGRLGLIIQAKAFTVTSKAEPTSKKAAVGRLSFLHQTQNRRTERFHFFFSTGYGETLHLIFHSFSPNVPPRKPIGETERHWISFFFFSNQTSSHPRPLLAPHPKMVICDGLQDQL